MAARSALFLALLLLGGCATGILVGGGRNESVHYPAESDAQITNEINRRLVADPAVDAMAVQVETHQGVVTLSGRVADRAAADRVARIAGGVEGVKELRNRLTIGKTLKH